VFCNVFQFLSNEAVALLFNRRVLSTPLVPAILFKSQLTSQQILRFATEKNAQETKHVKQTFHDWVSQIDRNITIKIPH